RTGWPRTGGPLTAGARAGGSIGGAAFRGGRTSCGLVLAREIGRAALARLEPLVAGYPFKAYRNYRALSRKKQDEVQRAELAGALASAGGFGLVAGDPARIAAIVRPLPWDSAFFALPMARLLLVHDGSPGRDGLGRLIGAACEASRAHGVRHLSARLDVADAEAIQALEDAGFRMMDALATYIYPLKRPAPEAGKDMGVLRLY